MNKIATAPSTHLPPLPTPDDTDQDYESIKLISQEIIEEKEAIIQQIYRQLKDSITTIDMLTNQIEAYKRCQPQQISLWQLQEKGFIQKENQSYFCLIDVTKAIQQSKQSIKIDNNLQIIHQAGSGALQEKFKSLESRYIRAMQQCDLFLKALTQKDQKEEILNIQISALKEKQTTNHLQLKKVLEEMKRLQLECNQLKKQHQFQKNQHIKERQQLCFQLSEMKKLTNKQNQRTRQLYQQNEQLAKTVSALQQKVKILQLQKMQREYLDEDLIRSYKRSIKHSGFSSFSPEREQTTLQKQNKANLANVAIISSIQQQKAKNQDKQTIKQLFRTISIEESSYPSANHLTQQTNPKLNGPNNIPNPTPEVKTAQNQEKQQIPPETLEKLKDKTRKQRKVVRINF